MFYVLSTNQNPTYPPIFYGRTFWEEWRPCITVMWHYAKTPRSTSGFLEIIFGLFFGKYVIVQCCEDFLGGMATLHYGYVALCKNTMEH